MKQFKQKVQALLLALCVLFLTLCNFIFSACTKQAKKPIVENIQQHQIPLQKFGNSSALKGTITYDQYVQNVSDFFHTSHLDPYLDDVLDVLSYLQMGTMVTSLFMAADPMTLVLDLIINSAMLVQFVETLIKDPKEVAIAFGELVAVIPAQAIATVLFDNIQWVEMEMLDNGKLRIDARDYYETMKVNYIDDNMMYLYGYFETPSKSWASPKFSLHHAPNDDGSQMEQVFEIDVRLVSDIPKGKLNLVVDMYNPGDNFLRLLTTPIAELGSEMLCSGALANALFDALLHPHSDAILQNITAAGVLCDKELKEKLQSALSVSFKPTKARKYFSFDNSPLLADSYDVEFWADFGKGEQLLKPDKVQGVLSGYHLELGDMQMLKSLKVKTFSAKSVTTIPNPEYVTAVNNFHNAGIYHSTSDMNAILAGVGILPTITQTTSAPLDFEMFDANAQMGIFAVNKQQDNTSQDLYPMLQEQSQSRYAGKFKISYDKYKENTLKTVLNNPIARVQIYTQMLRQTCTTYAGREFNQLFESVLKNNFDHSLIDMLFAENYPIEAFYVKANDIAWGLGSNSWYCDKWDNTVSHMNVFDHIKLENEMFKLYAFQDYLNDVPKSTSVFNVSVSGKPIYLESEGKNVYTSLKHLMLFGYDVVKPLPTKERETIDTYAFPIDKNNKMLSTILLPFQKQ